MEILRGNGLRRNHSPSSTLDGKHLNNFISESNMKSSNVVAQKLIIFLSMITVENNEVISLFFFYYET